MAKTLRVLIYLALPVIALCAGHWLGPDLHQAYRRWFGPAAFETGNYEEIYRNARKHVVVYGTSTCPACQHLRQFLDDANIDYKDYRIDQSGPARSFYDTLNEQVVPITFIGDRLIRGADDVLISESLRRSGYLLDTTGDFEKP